MAPFSGYIFLQKSVTHGRASDHSAENRHRNRASRRTYRSDSELESAPDSRYESTVGKSGSEPLHEKRQGERVLFTLWYKSVTVGSPLLSERRTTLEYMPEFLSKNDRQRIATFVATPKYERDPELLIPEEEE